MAGVELVSMMEKEDWIMRPVLRGMCKMESLLDGTVGLLEVSIMNEALDVESENRSMIEKRLRNDGH